MEPLLTSNIFGKNKNHFAFSNSKSTPFGALPSHTGSQLFQPFPSFQLCLQITLNWCTFYSIFFSMEYVSPELSLSYILKAHRSFSSGVPEPVMSVANMNSCFVFFQKIYVLVYLYTNVNISTFSYSFLFSPVQFLMFHSFELTQ